MSAYDDSYYWSLYKIDKSNPYPEESKEWAEWEEAIIDASIDARTNKKGEINGE